MLGLCEGCHYVTCYDNHLSADTTVITEFTLEQHLYVITVCGFQEITVPRKITTTKIR